MNVNSSNNTLNHAKIQGHIKIWAAHFVLALGGLFIGTGEFSVMGLLPNIAQTFNVNIPKAGHLISIYAGGVIIGSPLLAIIGAKMER